MHTAYQNINNSTGERTSFLVLRMRCKSMLKVWFLADTCQVLNLLGAIIFFTHQPTIVPCTRWNTPNSLKLDLNIGYTPISPTQTHKLCFYLARYPGNLIAYPYGLRSAILNTDIVESMDQMRDIQMVWRSQPASQDRLAHDVKNFNQHGFGISR